MRCAVDAASHEVGVWMLRSPTALRATNAERKHDHAQRQIVPTQRSARAAAWKVCPGPARGRHTKMPQEYACFRTRRGTARARIGSNCGANERIQQRFLGQGPQYIGRRWCRRGHGCRRGTGRFHQRSRQRRRQSLTQADISPPTTARRHAKLAAMDTRQLLAMALDPGAILRARGFTVDQWQTDVLLVSGSVFCWHLAAVVV
jgi:hypothetical protein